MITPLFAMVAATSAFSSGVSATSFCPMLDMPSAAASAIGPTVDWETWRGIVGGVVSSPTALAVDRILAARVLMPSWTKALWQDFATASGGGAFVPAPHAA